MRGNGRSGTDTEMVVAARDGDQGALEELVADSLPLVYNIVGRALGAHSDVDDVVQETLLRVVRGLSDLRDPDAFRSWLVAITVRQVRNRDHYRRTRHGRPVQHDRRSGAFAVAQADGRGPRPRQPRGRLRR
ncbi:RNA polymerase sigma factor [Actinacidiphila oryziradicis]|uniref:RNA polymerase sigma factor n=1 Tax=Actinacidiphila oryziradicis TaxID=2571141 RepID=UPI001B80307A